MIREYAPIALIPAAWAMTFATMIYPALSTYWIQHMHYFMLLFLTGFTVLSWNEMDSPVLNIWRKVIAAGILFTGFGALSFSFTEFSYIFVFLSLSYWFIAPGIALYHSSEHMDEYSTLYRSLAAGSVIGYFVLILGLYNEAASLQIIAVTVIALVQTISIVKASKLDRKQ